MPINLQKAIEHSLEPISVPKPEAARILGLSEKTLYELYMGGKIPHFRVGVKLLFPVDGLRKWVADQAQQAQQKLQEQITVQAAVA